MKEIDPHLPIDKIAALVVSNSYDKGFDFECGDKITSMSPLPTCQFSGVKEHDLTGRTFGYFTVIGCAVYRPKNHLTNRKNTVRWVCKCRCGRYQMFSSKTVKKNGPQFNDGYKFQIACVECEKTHRLRGKNWAVIDIMNEKL